MQHGSHASDTDGDLGHRHHRYRGTVYQSADWCASFPNDSHIRIGGLAAGIPVQVIQWLTEKLVVGDMEYPASVLGW